MTDAHWAAQLLVMVKRPLYAIPEAAGYTAKETTRVYDFVDWMEERITTAQREIEEEANGN